MKRNRKLQSTVFSRVVVTSIVVVLVIGVGGPKLCATPVSVFINSPENNNVCGISDFGIGQQEADDFVLGGPYLTVTEVRWWGAYGADPDPTPSDNFIIRFFSDASGKPTANPFKESLPMNLTRAATELVATAWAAHDGGTVYEYNAELSSPLIVDAGITYYISIVNDTGSSWGWLENGQPSHWFRFSDGVPWNESERSTNLAFELFGIPEPATISLFAIGALALLRKRQG